MSSPEIKIGQGLRDYNNIMLHLYFNYCETAAHSVAYSRLYCAGCSLGVRSI